jgi:hypothetical protein
MAHPWIHHDAAELVLATFTATFMVARIVVLLIMLRVLPDMYLRARSTHVHHLNYGIVLLSVTGLILVLVQPEGRALQIVTTAWAIGLGLTYDEFGMWLHLGGPYWQRASFDAVTAILCVLGLLAFAPDLERFRTLHWVTAAGLGILLTGFGVLLWRSGRFAARRLSPRLKAIEAQGPKE